MTSTAGSPAPLAEPVKRASYVLNGRGEAARPRLEALARDCGVEIVAADEEADLAVVLGGDGTMLRAFQIFLGRSVPVFGVNFGRFGFLSSAEPDDLEDALRRAFAGDYVVIELPTLELESGDVRAVAVNDIVATTADLGRMVELEWAVGGEPLGVVPCDAVILATPSGSTAYNLSNGGPVLMWGIDAMAVSFVAPHSLHARPLVVPRSRDVVVTNRTQRITLALVADGQRVGNIPPGGSVTARLGQQRSMLATLPDATFLTRFRSAFA
jgi:NAD+ kinase